MDLRPPDPPRTRSSTRTLTQPGPSMPKRTRKLSFSTTTTTKVIETNVVTTTLMKSHYGKHMESGGGNTTGRRAEGVVTDVKKTGGDEQKKEYKIGTNGESSKEITLFNQQMIAPQDQQVFTELGFERHFGEPESSTKGSPSFGRELATKCSALHCVKPFCLWYSFGQPRIFRATVSKGIVHFEAKYYTELDKLYLIGKDVTISVAKLREYECDHAPIESGDVCLFEKASIRSKCGQCLGDVQFFHSFLHGLSFPSPSYVRHDVKIGSKIISVSGMQIFLHNSKRTTIDVDSYVDFFPKSAKTNTSEREPSRKFKMLPNKSTTEDYPSGTKFVHFVYSDGNSDTCVF